MTTEKYTIIIRKTPPAEVELEDLRHFTETKKGETEGKWPTSATQRANRAKGRKGAR